MANTNHIFTGDVDDGIDDIEGGIATCSCGWVSKRESQNMHKSWRQHVTRGTK